MVSQQIVELIEDNIRCSSCGKPRSRKGKHEIVYGDRYRHGETISTAFVESTVNHVVSKRMVKKQQMRWSERGAHHLLQVRTQVLNEDLRKTFCRWYPGMQIPSSKAELKAAA
jgi:hypothetical protein